MNVQVTYTTVTIMLSVKTQLAVIAVLASLDTVAMDTYVQVSQTIMIMIMSYAQLIQ